MAACFGTAAVAMGHVALKRVIRRAQARRYVTINAAEVAPMVDEGPSSGQAEQTAADWPGCERCG
jgi:hypothetical protein